MKHPPDELLLDDLLTSAANNGISLENIADFNQTLGRYKIIPTWVEHSLRTAYAELNIRKIWLLLDCIRQDSFKDSNDKQAVPSILCQIMEDTRCHDLAEEIADILGDFVLEKSAIGSFVKTCTSPAWNELYGWPDLRKALSSMYSIYLNGSCSEAEIIAALREIIDSPNTINEDYGIRDLALALIDKANEPRSKGCGSDSSEA